MKLEKIITHPGGAHKDEFLAIALLMADQGETVLVERREPSAEELDNPEIAVVDIGGRDDLGRMNFDHHQYPREAVPCCALSLVLRHLGLYEEARTALDWLETTEWIDVRGPNVTAAWLGIDRDQMAKLNTPVDGALLRWFAQESRWEANAILLAVMLRIGEDLLNYLRNWRARVAWAKTHRKEWVLEVRGNSYRVWYLPRMENLLEDASSAMAQLIRSEGLEKEIAVLVYPDSRAEGYGMARYQDHPDFDFTRLQGLSDVHFAHASGFMAKTSANSWERLEILIRLACVAESQ